MFTKNKINDLQEKTKRLEEEINILSTKVPDIINYYYIDKTVDKTIGAISFTPISTVIYEILKYLNLEIIKIPEKRGTITLKKNNKK